MGMSFRPRVLYLLAEILLYVFESRLNDAKGNAHPPTSQFPVLFMRSNSQSVKKVTTRLTTVEFLILSDNFNSWPSFKVRMCSIRHAFLQNRDKILAWRDLEALQIFFPRSLLTF